MPIVLTSLVILGCSQRKRQTSRLLPAIERYDGPVFRVLRKRIREEPERPPNSLIISGRFGLIASNYLIPKYDQRLSSGDYSSLRSRVEKQLKETLDSIQPDRVFVSVGASYWPLLEEPLERQVPQSRLVVARGGIGGRASQLVRWLRPHRHAPEGAKTPTPTGEAVLLDVSVRLTRAEVLRKARTALFADPEGARRFETWYVPLGRDRVAPKWLVSILFDKPVAHFRTADARRALSCLGIECIYANY